MATWALLVVPPVLPHGRPDISPRDFRLADYTAVIKTTAKETNPVIHALPNLNKNRTV